MVKLFNTYGMGIGKGNGSTSTFFANANKANIFNFVIKLIRASMDPMNIVDNIVCNISNK